MRFPHYIFSICLICLYMIIIALFALLALFAFWPFWCRHHLQPHLLFITFIITIRGIYDNPQIRPRAQLVEHSIPKDTAPFTQGFAWPRGHDPPGCPAQALYYLLHLLWEFRKSEPRSEIRPRTARQWRLLFITLL